MQFIQGEWHQSPAGQAVCRDFNIKAGFPMYWDLWDQKYSWESVTDAADMGRYMEGQAWKSGNMSETIVNKMTYDGARNPTLYSMFADIRICNIALKNVSKIQDGNRRGQERPEGTGILCKSILPLDSFLYMGTDAVSDKTIGPNRSVGHSKVVKMGDI